MALGGGTFTVRNKVLPGAYINFVSAAQASSVLSERGIVAVAMELDWGPDGEIFGLTTADFAKNSLQILGHDMTDAEMKPLRELFRSARQVYLYKLNAGGVKASNSLAAAKYTGSLGNSLKTAVQANEASTEEAPVYDVITYLGERKVDIQTVKTVDELAANDYLTFKPGSTLTISAATPLTGGTNGTVENGAHQAFLDRLESYSVHVVAYAGIDSTLKALYAAYTRRMRDEVGVKLQCVMHRYSAADYEGVISIENNTAADLVYWVAGAAAGCAVNRSLTNRTYDGEYAVDTGYTQTELTEALGAGKMILHRVGNEVRVLKDINTLTTYTADKGRDFASNQTIRVLDQIANDIATMFNDRFLGKIPNDADGRISLWNEIVKHHQQLQTLRAIENFSADQVTVAAGDTKTSIVVSDQVSIIGAMEQLYMTVVVQ